MQIVIEIPNKDIPKRKGVIDIRLSFIDGHIVDADGYGAGVVTDFVELPKGHGKIVDIGKIDEDRIEKDNPIIYLTVNGEYIEAVSLDYLNSLPAIIEESEEQICQ